MAVYSRIAEEIAAGRKVALVTIIDCCGSINLTGNRLIISEGKVIYSSIRQRYLAELEAVSLAQYEKGQSNMVDAQLAQDTACRLFVHIYNPSPRLIILGGGHVGQALCKMAALLDFETVIIDDRPSFANQTIHPDADQIICETFEKGFKLVDPSPYDYIVIVTRGHQHDRFCLEKALSGKFAYLGMIGSKKKVRAQLQELAKAGYSKEQLESVYSPIGLPIGAVTEAEIALSILAEITRVRRSKSSGEEVQEKVMRELISLEESGGRAVLATIIEARGSTPRKRGSQMLVYPEGQLAGTIGGGCAEADVRRQALLTMDRGISRLVSLDLNADAAAEQGMACGGKMEIFLELLTFQ
ncbi:MAG: XdhC family protein [Bacillota bacterium]